MLSFLEGGRGRPLVFVHGAGNRAEVWQRVLSPLEGEYHVFAIDLPGHGESSFVPCARVEDYSAQVLDFLEALDLQEVTLVGHSMGGAVILKAAPFSRRVSSLVLVGTGARLRVNPRLLQLLREDFPRGVELMVRWSFPRGTPEPLVREAEEMLWRSGQVLLLQDLLACDVYSARGELGAISLPTLILCGSQDVMTPLSLSGELRDGVRGAELRILDGAGHMLQMERGEEVAQAIASFLRQQA